MNLKKITLKNYLTNLKNALKSNINRFVGFFIDRWKTLTEDDEKPNNKRKLMEEEKKENTAEVKEEIKDDNTDNLEALKQELEELRKFKETREKTDARKQTLKEENIDETVGNYLAILLDNMEGDSDTEKLNVIKKDLPQLFNKQEPEKSFKIKLEKMTEDDEKKTKQNNLNKLGIGTI